MSARPLWFGPPDRPLFGWMHAPRGDVARGAVVLCTTLGVQATCAQRAFRILASQLAAAGWLVLRFDGRATGDSSGQFEDGDMVRGWTSDVIEATNLVREAGASRVALVGMRLGATLAASASLDTPVHSLVLWDPCEDGRSFVREQKALRAASIPDAVVESGDGVDTGSTEILGAVLPAHVVAELERLRVPEGRVLAERTLVLTRPDRPRTKRRLSTLAGAVEWGEADGQAELVDVLPSQAVVPQHTLARIARWLDDGRDAQPFSVRAVGRPEAVLRGPEGTDVVERPVRLGEAGLFGMVSEPLSGASGPPVVFINAGRIDHVGPARLWVDLSREFAAAGRPALRFDLSGLGDSPPHPGVPDSIAYPPEAIADVGVALRAVAGEGTAPVTLIGLCSGAYHAMEAAIALHGSSAPATTVCAINPILHFDPPPEWAVAGHTRRQQTAQPFRRWIRVLRRFGRLAGFAERHVPPGVWWALDRVGLQPHPARGFEALAGSRIPTLLVCGDVEASHFQRRGKWAVRRAIAGGNLQFEVLPRSDHTLFGAAARARAAELVRAWVARHDDAGRAVPVGTPPAPAVPVVAPATRSRPPVVGRTALFERLPRRHSLQ